MKLPAQSARVMAHPHILFFFFFLAIFFFSVERAKIANNLVL
jgi:hypothetical protein